MHKQELSQPEFLRLLERKVLTFVGEGRGSFEALALEVHTFQRANCAPYAAFCSAHANPTCWQEIPAVPLSAFRHAAIRCFPEKEISQTFRTSGTTGEGYGQHHFRTLEIYQAAALQGWKRAGLPSGTILSLTPSPVEAPHSSLSRMAGWLTKPEHFFAGRWDALTAALGEVPADTPIHLFGTALAFLDLFEWLGSRRISLPPGSTALETGGYKGSQRSLSKGELYAMFETSLGLAPDSIWNEYGMTELSSQFYTRGLDRPHSGAPWVRTLVIDPESGQEVGIGGTGLLKIFDLANVGSCLALQTRDLAVRHEDGFLLIGRDPSALPRGCSRSADEMLLSRDQRPSA